MATHGLLVTASSAGSHVEVEKPNSEPPVLQSSSPGCLLSRRSARTCSKGWGPLFEVPSAGLVTASHSLATRDTFCSGTLPSLPKAACSPPDQCCCISLVLALAASRLPCGRCCDHRGGSGAHLDLDSVAASQLWWVWSRWGCSLWVPGAAVGLCLFGVVAGSPRSAARLQLSGQAAGVWATAGGSEEGCWHGFAMGTV